jgi:hypothetical protein
MSYRKATTSTLRHPHSGPIEWVAFTNIDAATRKPNGHLRSERVTAQSWYEARAAACALLHVEPYEVELISLDDAYELALARAA